LKVKAIPALLLYTPCFLGGVIGYRLWSEARLNVAPWVWPFAITVCVGLRAIAEAASFPSATVVASAWVACLLLGLAVPQFRELRPGFVRHLAAKIARYSYGIYLSQCAVFWIAFVLLRRESIWAQTAVCAGLSIVLPIALYHAVEKPMIGLGARASSMLAGQDFLQQASTPSPRGRRTSSGTSPPP
jgi:peptidoglycan/LPS O-acetylase OafA/YrhL